MYPFYQEIPYADPLCFLALFAEKNGVILLNSAQLKPGCGRYSFLAVDPFFTFSCKNDFSQNPWQYLADEIKKFPLQCHAALPPFQGGVAGFFSYDAYQYLEKITSSQIDDMQFPDMVLGFYDLVIAFDHELKKAWIFSSGYPEQETSRREKHAKTRCAELFALLERREFLKENVGKTDFDENYFSSNFSQQNYCDAVNQVKDYILAGDIFQANISQRFSCSLKVKPFELYRSLCFKNPAPFASYLVFDGAILVSASPERFLKVTQKQVESRPIKGTRPRGKDSNEDQQFANELMKSKKDHAENVMIVDLMRNDLSRVCEDHSVHVAQLCQLESYATVHHLVSVVTGRLAPQWNAIDLLRVAFPGGSITGAPKIRAMEIIAEIEPTKRGPYCGCIGYIGFNGDMDTSITIRTLAIKNNQITFQAGGAIVLDSDPVTEFEETLTKSHALKRTIYATTHR